MSPRTFRLLLPAFGIAIVAYLAVAPARPVAVALSCALAAAACVRGPRGTGETGRLPWLLLAGGFAGLGLGEVVQRSVAGSGTDWGTPLRAAALVAFALGIWRLPRDPGLRSRFGFVDPAIVATGAALVSWLFVLEPLARREDAGAVDLVISLSIPILDIVLLAAGVRPCFAAGGVTGPVRSLLAGMGALVAGDTLRSVASIRPSPAADLAAGSLLIVAAGLVAAAAAHDSATSMTASPDARDGRVQPRRLALLCLAALAGPVALIVAAAAGSKPDVPVVVAGIALVLVLILLRMGQLVQFVAAGAREQAHATGRERTMRRSAHALAAATDRNAIFAVAADAAAALVRDRPFVEVRLFVGDAAEMQLVAVRGVRSDGAAALALADLPGWAVEQLRADESATLRLGDDGVDDAVAAAVGATREHPHCLLSPLIVDGAIAGVLATALERPAGASRRRAIDTVCLQAALAIETATLTEALLARAGEERFRSLVQNASDVIAVVEPGGIIRFITRSVTAMLGYDPSQLEGASLARILHRDDAGGGPAMLVDGHVLDWRIRSVDGGFRQAEVIVADLREDPNVGGIVLTMRDVTERRELESRLAHQAFHDTLTGLANRALFEDRLGQALARHARRPTGAVAVIFLDLDDFKGVNDTLGHQAGDELLCLAARRLEHCLRPTDTAARLGGDEFAIALEIDDFDPLEAVRVVADRVLKELGRPFMLTGREVGTRGSIGIALTPDAGETVDELLQSADVAMYAAKRGGKGSFRIFEPGMGAAPARARDGAPWPADAIST